MASAYLTRSTGTPDSRTKFTLSAWFKPSLSSSGNGEVFGFYGSNDYFAVRTQSSSALDIILYDNSTIARKGSTRKFRDCSGFYHILVALDTSLSTAEDRIKIYINNERITDFTNDTNFSQDAEVIRSSMATVGVGTNVDQNGDRANFDGIITHAHYCDGYAYSPTDFGSTDSTTGIWKPKTSPSVSYGTAGFFLDFADSSAMGNDVSGNNNDFTSNGTGMTQTIDTPSNVFATLNPLYNSGGTVTYANGNNNLAESDNQWKTTFSTLGASSGKYYAEFKAKGNYYMIGVADYNVTKSGIADRNFSSTTYISEQGYGYYNGNGDLYYRGSSTSYGATYGNGDIVQVALDCDNNRVFFGKNGTWQNSADPTTPSTGFAMTATDATYVFAVAVQNNNLDCNFGNGYFGTTAVSSAGTNAGVGTFEYDVPSGYKALCTKNINAEEYS